MSPALRLAIEKLYEVFTSVRKPAGICGCPCCIDEAQACLLLGKPRRQLTPEELSDYAQKVFLTVGDLPDFMYLLPRIIEIMMQDRDWWPAPEVVLRALRNANFPEWAAPQQEAIMHVFDTLFDDLLCKAHSGSHLDTWICSLGRLGREVSPYLRKIADHPARLLEYYEWNSEPLAKGRLANAFWEENKSGSQQVLAWFNSAAIQERIFSAYGLR